VRKKRYSSKGIVNKLREVDVSIRRKQTVAVTFKVGLN
jgi:hypothetical protein